MSSFKIIAAASVAASLTVAAAHAADLGVPPPCGPGSYGVGGPCGPAPDFSGWYLRGYVGMTNQSVKSAGYSPNPFPADVITTPFMNFDSSPLFGGGIGYQFNNWLRVDATGELRGSAHFHGQQGDQSAFNPDDYNASKSEALFLVNGFVDLGTWWHVTPFVGAGIGASRNTISGFTDIGPAVGADYVGATASKWNLAWAAYAGLSYEVTRAVSIEFMYRYVSLGSAQTGPVTSVIPFVAPSYPFVFNNLTSNDFMLGVRLKLGEPQAPLPPLVTKG